MSWMNDTTRPVPSFSGPGTRTYPQATFDAGLRAHMIGVYNTLMLGLALSGVVAYLVANTALGTLFYAAPHQLTFLGGAALLAPLALILFVSFSAHRLSVSAIQGVYWGITALQGIGLAALLQAYTGESIARVFFITAATFGATALWGYTTKRDLSGMGNFMFMGLIGIVIAGLVNIFLASSALQFAISVIGVVVFTGLTAWDMQRLKSEYYEYGSGEIAQKGAIMGALSLYLDFINLFVMMLQLFGTNRE